MCVLVEAPRDRLMGWVFHSLLRMLWVSSPTGSAMTEGGGNNKIAVGGGNSSLRSDDHHLMSPSGSARSLCSCTATLLVAIAGSPHAKSQSKAAISSGCTLFLALAQVSGVR